MDLIDTKPSMIEIKCKKKRPYKLKACKKKKLRMQGENEQEKD